MNMLRNAVPQSPFAIRRVDIYRSSPRPGNLVAEVLFPSNTDPSYPSPAVENGPGDFTVAFSIPEDFVTNDVYFDVWHFVGSDPGTVGIDDESRWISQMGMFWVFEDIWLTDDELRTKRLGFEPLDRKFRRGEIRNLEVAIHPLPKYDYDYNQITPIIPQLAPTISIYTPKPDCELIIQDAPCKVGIRQGHHRNSPFVIQCLLDTRSLIRGTYQYAVKVNVGPEIIISPRFNFTVQ
jgi:hypothetical protein